MSLVVQCPGCERRLNVPATAAGKKAKCPKCQTAMLIPAAEEEPGFEVVEDDFEVVEDKPPKKRPVQKSDTIECPECGEENDSDARRCDNCDARLTEEKPKKKKRVKKKKHQETHGGWFGLERGIVGSGVIGGVIAMVVAVVWFVLGWLNGWIYFYPPILFVVGLVAAIKGMAGQSE